MRRSSTSPCRPLNAGSQATARNRGGGNKTESWSSRQKRRSSGRSPTFPASSQPRLHSRRAPTAIRRDLWHFGLHLQHQPGFRAARSATQKKTLFASERDEEERSAWREQIGRIDPKRLVFVDECGTHTSMTRRYARAPKGERAYGSVPRNRGTNTTLVASMTLGGVSAAMATEGSTTAKVFEASVLRGFWLLR